MSPRLDAPLNRREAVTSLLAMLAFLMGPRDIDAESPPPQEQPHPGSSIDWGAELMMFAGDDHLPIPRNLDLEARFVFDGQTLRMDLQQEPDPAWIDDVEQDWIPLGSFVFTGNPTTLLDYLSVESDAAWLKNELRRVNRKTTWCPECCGVYIEREGVCRRCNGTGRLSTTPEVNLRAVRHEEAERQALIDAACQAAGQLS